MSSADVYAFGAEVRRRRREQGMGLAELAERGGVTAGFACGVARLLGTSAEALLSTPSAELAQALTRAA